MTSIKTKNKLFRRYFKGNDFDKKAFYTKYLNELTHIAYHAKRSYYENLIKTNNQNSSQIWSIIKEIIECKKNSTKNKLPTAFLIENQMVNTNLQVFFLTIYASTLLGANMAKNVPQISNSFKIFINSCIQPFALPEICEEEINSCIDNMFYVSRKQAGSGIRLQLVHKSH